MKPKNPERWATLKKHFEELLDLDAAHQQERLTTLASTDPELCEQLAHLLAADVSADRRLRRLESPFSPPLPAPHRDTPTADAGAATGPADAPAAPGLCDPFGLSGRTVSHFAVQEVLGAGGMGVVYRAEDLRLGRSVALKFLLPQYSLDVSAKERFLLEARAASALDHPHICTIHEAGESKRGQLFLAMSCYAGETLKARLQREGALPVQEAISLAQQICSALGAAHGAGIVHRDVKPGNLMLTAEGTLKVLDFGLAKVRDLNLTGSGMQPGTAAYMSPEQLSREEVDGRSDLWSLGVVLYQMLTGELPFGAGHELSTVYRILYEEPAAPSALRAEIPPGVEQITLRLLQKEREERYASAAEVKEAIEAVQVEQAQPGERRGSRRSSLGRGRRLPRQLRPRRVQALAVSGVLLLVLLGTLAASERGQRVLTALGLGAEESLLSRGVLAERERMLLADFTSPTGDSTLARMATVAFRIDLAQSPILTLVEPQQVRAALARMERSDAEQLDAPLAREVAVREGIKAVLTGEIARTGSGYLLSAQLQAAESGEILAAHRETARDSTALLAALDRLSKQVRRQIGESLRSVRTSPPLAQVTTSSLDALRKFSQAQEVFRREGDNPRVIALLEEAVALDTTFAMAYRTLGMTLRRLGEQPSQRTEALTRAYQYRHRLPDRERYHLAGTYYTYVTWELEKAITTYRTLLDSYPEDAQALNNLGVVYSMTGNYERAEEMTRRALEADSGSAIRTSSLIAWQFNQGKLEEADSTFVRFAARFSGNSAVTYRAVFLASAQGDYAAAASRAHAERQVRREDLTMQLFMARSLADLASLHGRFREAEHYTREVDQFIERQGDPATHLVEALHLAHLEITLGLPRARSLERVEGALAKHPLDGMSAYDRPYPDLAAFYARAGQPARARAFLAEWQKETPLELQRIQTIQRVRPLWGKALPWALGEIALAEGRPQEAAEHFRLANHGRCLICALPNLGRAYEAARQPDSAIVAYERFLGTPFMNRLWYDAEWRAPVLERLGQLHEARGDHAQAAERYAEFIELWQHADPELQPRVREARRRLAALR